MSRVAFKGATTRPVSEIAAELQEVLGQRLVAYAADVQSPKLVGRWAMGDHDPRLESEKRLRALYRVFLTLRQGDFGDGTIRAFVTGENPDLNDRQPLDVIRDGHGTDAVRAAEAFIA